MFDTLMLSRIQFGANISFHILFPSITIALGWVLLFFKLRHVATGNPGWLEAYRFWVRVFALTFALGVVSGITMSFQFGTNWPGYMETVGNIAGRCWPTKSSPPSFLKRCSSGSCCLALREYRPGYTR